NCPFSEQTTGMCGRIWLASIMECLLDDGFVDSIDCRPGASSAVRARVLHRERSSVARHDGVTQVRQFSRSSALRGFVSGSLRRGIAFAKWSNAYFHARSLIMKRFTIWAAASCIGFAMASLGGQPAASAHGDKDAMFHKMDANGDGKISQEEHAAGAKAMFDAMDADHNGTVTEAEMTAGHEKMMGQAGDKSGDKKAPHHEMSSADKIKAVDTNGDGKLTAAEHEAGSKMMFDKMDTDHDGSLTKAEFASGHAKLMHSKTK
ncbi:MAG TPA: hypothetical protein VHU40_06900, partial [Polyangia bacterium]|nr:hypothetical protein [Polyangia bacterium]